MYTPYRRDRYSSDYSYKNQKIHGRLCKKCGYPYGKHYGFTEAYCPGDKKPYEPGNWPAVPDSFPKEFYSEELNINTKVI